MLFWASKSCPRRNRALQPYLRPHVLVIDEMGYLGYEPGAADVLFQVVDQRYLKGKPILLTTNKPLNQWGRVLHDEELARAIIDRTLHHGEYLKLTGPSFRLKGRTLDLDINSTEQSTETVPEKSGKNLSALDTKHHCLFNERMAIISGITPSFRGHNFWKPHTALFWHYKKRMTTNSS